MRFLRFSTNTLQSHDQFHFQLKQGLSWLNLRKNAGCIAICGFIFAECKYSHGAGAKRGSKSSRAAGKA
jgi:hypothetical protein